MLGAGDGGERLGDVGPLDLVVVDEEPVEEGLVELAAQVGGRVAVGAEEAQRRVAEIRRILDEEALAEGEWTSEREPRDDTRRGLSATTNLATQSSPSGNRR